MTMQRELDGRVTIITGAASGIGRGAVSVFAREGARLVLADVNEAEGQAAGEAARANGGEAIFVQCDVSKESDVAAVVAAALSTYGRLDCAFNNAGIGPPLRPLVEHTEEDWRRVSEVDLLSVFLCLKHQIPEMEKAGGGAIVNVSSNSALRAVATIAPYSAMKAGILGLTRTAAVESAPKNIRVNAISPGLIGVKPGRVFEKGALKMPLQRPGEWEEIGEVAAFLLSPRASYIIGQTICVDGGATIV
jgi:NAD(P)-dependent dehydrogenase (short-subunit alcohol dehydrogenase family)